MGHFIRIYQIERKMKISPAFILLAGMSTLLMAKPKHYLIETKDNEADVGDAIINDPDTPEPVVDEDPVEAPTPAEPAPVDAPVDEPAEPAAVDVPVDEPAEPATVDAPVDEPAEPAAVDTPKKQEPEEEQPIEKDTKGTGPELKRKKANEPYKRKNVHNFQEFCRENRDYKMCQY